MGSGYASLGGVPVEIRDTSKEGEVFVRQCWTSSENYIELCVHDPDRETLYLLDMSEDDARKLAQVLNKSGLEKWRES